MGCVFWVFRYKNCAFSSCWMRIILVRMLCYAVVLLKWAMQRGIASLVRASSTEHLEENLRAALLPDLSADHMTLLDTLQHLVTSPVCLPVALSASLWVETNDVVVMCVFFSLNGTVSNDAVLHQQDKYDGVWVAFTVLRIEILFIWETMLVDRRLKGWCSCLCAFYNYIMYCTGLWRVVY